MSRGKTFQSRFLLVPGEKSQFSSRKGMGCFCPRQGFGKPGALRFSGSSARTFSSRVSLFCIGDVTLVKKEHHSCVSRLLGNCATLTVKG